MLPAGVAGGGGVARVWVTGGSGFLGRQIVAALRELGAQPVTGPRVDLLDPAARARAAPEADILVHAAWITTPGRYPLAPENLDWIAATLDLASRFPRAGGRRVVLVGSCAEYDWSRPGRTPWREARQCRPASLYGASKLAAWAALEAFARHAGLSAANARVFIPVGPYEAPARLLPGLIRAARDGRGIDIGPAGTVRDFIDVRDAGAAVAHLALSNLEGPVNICSGRATTLGELARLAVGDAPAVRFGARGVRFGEPRWMVGDPERLRVGTGFAPRFALERTVADARAFWSEAA